MSKELVISANRHETKVAILEDDQLVEVFFQRANEYSLAGSIHKGPCYTRASGHAVGFRRPRSGARHLPLRIGFLRGERGFRSRSREPGRRPPQSASSVLPRSLRRPKSHPPKVSRRRQRRLTRLLRRRLSRQAASTPVSPSERSEEGDRGDRRGAAVALAGDAIAAADSPIPNTLPRCRGAPRVEETPVVSEPRPRAASPAHSDAAAGSGQDFAVLPGESLAKYTRSQYSAFGRSGRRRDPQPPATRTRRDRAGSRLGADSEPEAEEAEPQEEFPAQFAGAAAMIDELESAPPSEVPSSGQVAAALAAMATAEPDVLAEEGAAQAEIPEGLEAETESESDAPPEALAAGQPGEAAAAAPQLTAQLREPGGRYMHRLPRRMRRKMRGGGPGESRTETEFRAGGVQTQAAVDSASCQSREASRTVVRPAKSAVPSITELLKEGQEIIVQIAKEPLGQKGARITSHIALPGRYVVYMPTLEHTGVSRKIASDEERLRLKRILQIHHAGIPGGFIVRTAGEGKSEDDLAADMNFLFNLWLDIRQKAEKKPAPGAAAPRSRHRAAHPARSVHRRVQGHLGGQRRDVRKRAALRAALPAGAGHSREAVHAPRADLRRLQRSPRNSKKLCGPRCG